MNRGAAAEALAARFLMARGLSIVGRNYRCRGGEIDLIVRDGKTLTTDGPFAETREQLGGYYLIEAKDLDAALAIAARIPGARVGSIEVRPIWVYN